MTRVSNNDPHPAAMTNGKTALPAGSRGGALPRRVLITGGAGFIGTNVAAHLAQEGSHITIFDNLSRPGVEANLAWLRKTFPNQIHLMHEDVRDPIALQRAVRRCDTVFHFAAQVAVTTSLLDPETDFEINAHGTLNVLEACRELASPPRLLFTSTNKVYGDLHHIPLVLRGEQYQPRCEETAATGVSESCPLSFHSPYGCSKGTADQYVLDYARCWNLPAVVFRMSCIYGPHQCGTEDQGWVAHFARRILRQEPTMIYGDGCQVRDLLFVEDLVRAMTSAVTNIQATRGQAFNVGGGPQNAISVRQAIDKLARLHGGTSEVGLSEWRQGDQRYYVSDTRRLQQAIGWKPRVGVDEGITRLYQWLKAHQTAAAPVV